MDENVVKQLTRFARQFNGTVFRSVSLRYSRSKDVVSGEGSCRTGGRWNPPGVRASYGSLTAEGAMAETLASTRYFELAAHTAMPRVFVAIHVDLTRVLDLTDTKVQKAGKFRSASLVGVDWRADVDAGRLPVTQRVGQSAANSGLEAILVPSAATTGELNLVVFIDNLLSSSQVVVLSADEMDS